MTASQRRQAIQQQLTEAKKPISASALAAMLGVSRQIVVGDVALLRAGGVAVDATPRGYRMHSELPDTGYCGILACAHSSDAAMRQELYFIVDNGGIAEDVTVENPLYGELRAPLHLASRYEVDNFMARAASQPQGLLSRMTGGVHLHTIHCEDEEAFERIRKCLEQAGILYCKDV